MWTAKRALISGGLAGIAALWAQSSAWSQADWPSKPLTFISPAPASSAEYLPRIIYEPVARALGTVLIIDYKQGLGGTLALEAVARSAPDGYTLGLPSLGSLGIATTVQASSLRYDPLKDFAGVARLVTTGNVIAANKDLPVGSIRELIDYAKARPGKLNFGAIAGFGTSYHLAWVLFAKRAEIDVAQIPFKGVTDAMQAVVGGDVELTMSNTNTLLAMIQSGRMKALAVTSAMREPSLPNVPTMIESGITGYEATSWFGVVVRAGTPQAVIDRLGAATLKSLQDPQVIASLRKIGVTPYPQGGKEFEAFYRTEISRWAQVVKDSGFKVQ